MVKIGRPNVVISSSPPPPTISNAGEKFIGEGRGVTRAPQNSGGVGGERGSCDCAVLRRGTLVVGLPLTIPASYPILALASLIENAPPPLSLPTKSGLENEDAINHQPGGGGWKKIRANFFPSPPPGVPPEKKAGTPCSNFFRQEEFFYYVLLELACHLHFATL